MSSDNQPNVSEIVSQSSPVGAPKGNKNAVKTGLYTAKTRDAIKARKKSRRITKKLANTPTELRPVLRDNLKDIEDIDDLCQLALAYLEINGITNEKGEPRRMLQDYTRLVKLKHEIRNDNGLTLTSLMATRKDSIHGDVMALQRWAEGGS
tara:strand:- start:73 stop:525 length:453 start_codon:yes stop_codon:yes gene_type:complete